MLLKKQERVFLLYFFIKRNSNYKIYLKIVSFKSGVIRYGIIVEWKNFTR